MEKIAIKVVNFTSFAARSAYGSRNASGQMIMAIQCERTRSPAIRADSPERL